MGAINDIMELTGLSQARMAAWLGVSKSLVQLAEKGERSLPTAATVKLSAMLLVMEQVKKAGKEKKRDEIAFTNPAKLALLHKKKEKFHQQSALALQVKLQKLKALRPKLEARLALIDVLKNLEVKWYKATARDNKWIEHAEWNSKERLPATGLEQQELLQDKIEVHMAYAELHKKRWERFENLTSII